MYSVEEGNDDLRRKELFSITTMLISTAVLAIFIWATVLRYGISGPYVVIYALWFFLSLRYTRGYLFLTPRKRYGTVTAIKDFKETQYSENGGAGRRYQRRYAIITECTLSVAFDGGKTGDFVFVYKGELKKLNLGDRIGIFRFLKMPVWETNPK